MKIHWPDGLAITAATMVLCFLATSTVVEGRRLDPVEAIRNE